MDYSVVIPAAGRGTRMGVATPKAFLACSGELSSVSHTGKGRDVGLNPANEGLSVLQRTVSVFSTDPSCISIVVCVPLDWLEHATFQLQKFKNVSVVAGGETRQISVSRGLYFLCHSLGARDDSVVLIHDGARCMVSEEVIARVVDGVVHYGAATAAIPVVDALVQGASGEAGAGPVVSTSVSREGVWAIQTPQGFLLRDIFAAHEEGLSTGRAAGAVDDATLVTPFRAVGIVPGDRMNIKVTTMEDLRFVALCDRGGL
jgi:2-C-methyl-D-erythritol 4-phosphate cytidylyltransferase